MKNREFRAGELVFVRSPEEILATLDADGALDGMPFMAEMLDACGRPFRVLRRAEKVCADPNPVRRFPDDDVVMLEGMRCDGTGHDGCNRSCRTFWKERWLRHADADIATPVGVSPESLAKLRARLKKKSDEDHYFCQSTQLINATELFPGRHRLLTFRLAWREIVNGDLSVFRVLRLLAQWIVTRCLRIFGADERLRGPNKHTVNLPLNLKPGEIVRIKSRARIVETLNQKQRNRGLGLCYEMTRCCGKEAEVRHRVDRLIDERTAVMRELSNTVTLRNVGGSKILGEECLCEAQVGDCPRGELMMWREVWLERP
jgi:hypothetical protein